jgi:hypothetical protein
MAAQGRASPRRLMHPLQRQPQSLRGTAKRAQPLCEIQIHIMVASEEAFGEVLRHADGMCEVQCGGAHGGQDVLN